MEGRGRTANGVGDTRNRWAGARALSRRSPTGHQNLISLPTNQNRTGEPSCKAGSNRQERTLVTMASRRALSKSAPAGWLTTRTTLTSVTAPFSSTRKSNWTEPVNPNCCVSPWLKSVWVTVSLCLGRGGRTPGLMEGRRSPGCTGRNAGDGLGMASIVVGGVSVLDDDSWKGCVVVVVVDSCVEPEVTGIGSSGSISSEAWATPPGAAAPPTTTRCSSWTRPVHPHARGEHFP